MCEPIMVGCDLHDDSMLLKIACGRAAAEMLSVRNTRCGRAAMIKQLRERSRAAGGGEVIFAYEASGQGFGLYDELTDAGITCHVLAPTKIARSLQHERRKTDEKDAEQILQLLRAHVLAGNALPTVWIPDPQTRDDREVVRARLDVARKITALKTQIQTLLKRAGQVRPESAGKGWTNGFRAWLKVVARRCAAGRRAALVSLLRQLEFVEEEIERLDEELIRLAESPRYRAAVEALSALCGVGLLTALVFLTEVGDLRRFANRRQISAYLGLVPKSFESGQRQDRKGHITRQGPSRVRRVLCQATWARVRSPGADREAYLRVASKNPHKKKIAVVAAMRRLAIRMWHQARNVPHGPAAPGNAALARETEDPVPSS